MICKLSNILLCNSPKVCFIACYCITKNDFSYIWGRSKRCCDMYFYVLYKNISEHIRLHKSWALRGIFLQPTSERMNEQNTLNNDDESNNNEMAFVATETSILFCYFRPKSLLVCWSIYLQTKRTKTHKCIVYNLYIKA